MLDKPLQFHIEQNRGFKVFKSNPLQFPYFSDQKIIENEWITFNKNNKESFRLVKGQHEEGFYIYVNRMAAKILLSSDPNLQGRGEVREVLFDEVVATGLDTFGGLLSPSGLFRTIVARKIKIVTERTN